ncbi:MAG: hydrogenase maturation nickel metallochaperone HypA [Pirellulaceae bacterium]|nr:hydrogenase maturation nickel metallochaperone HypA [Pirellulaceae bacterium]
MHELSIANSLVELVAQQVSLEEQSQVRVIRLRIGALSCVHRDALMFSFDLVTQDTPLSHAKLDIETVPISIYCPECDSIEQLDGIQSFRCPQCQTSSADIRSGRELDLYSLELEADDDERARPSLDTSLDPSVRPGSSQNAAHGEMKIP